MPVPASPPPQIERYRIVRMLGEGGMGSVWQAEDVELLRDVAIKVPHVFNDEIDPDVLTRFLREARAAAGIHHPNLCPVLDFGKTEQGRPYLVMPFLEGSVLSQHIDRTQPWPIEKAVSLVQRLAGALQALHEKGIIHRDLKPLNVMIRDNGEPVIMDFGLVALTTAQDTRLTKYGSVLGTPEYMSPEQLEGDVEAMGPPSDVYALGVVLYELLTGRPPFEGDYPRVYGQVMKNVPAPPSSLRAGLDQWLDVVCLKAMARRKEDRYASMKDFSTALSPIPPTVHPDDVKPRFGLRVGTLADLVLEAGKGATLPVRVTRENCKGPIELRLEDLPAGVQAREGFISAKAEEGAIEVKATEEAVAGTSTVRLRATVAEGSETRNLSLTVKARPTPYLAKEFVNSLKMKLVLIPAGKFWMGSPAEEEHREHDEEQHEVEITRAFYMGFHAVTQEQYQKVMGVNPSWFSSTGGGKAETAGMDTKRFPVESVSWEDAKKFCEELSKAGEEREVGRTYRLPTEAEWEYACRGGATGKVTHPFYFKNPISSLSSRQANCRGNRLYSIADFLKRTCEVGSYEANAFGFFDMHGNVWEWCQDYYGSYDSSIIKDPQGPVSSKGGRRVLRGGSWLNYGWNCRAAYRLRNDATYRDYSIGFRVVCVVRGR